MGERARVVVGVDGSASARTALEFALGEAARRDAVLDVVTVVVTPDYWPVGMGMASSGVPALDREQILDEVRQETEQYVIDVIGKGGAAAARVDVRVRAVPGPPAAMLIGQSSGIAAGEHGREELDSDREAVDRIAEAQLVVDEERDHRQRQSHGEIAEE